MGESEEIEKKKKKHKRKYSDSEDSSDSNSSHKKKKSKKHKKEKKKKDKKKKSKKEKIDVYGSYGLINTSDIYKKDAEFRTWLIEVKNISIEVLNPKAKKEYFEEYVEDYNTATFPDKKYYDLEKWEKSNLIDTTSAAATYSIKSDEEILRQQFKKKQVGVPSVQLTNEQLQELSRVNKERIEKDRLRKMGVKARDSLGVRYE